MDSPDWSTVVSGYTAPSPPWTNRYSVPAGHHCLWQPRRPLQHSSVLLKCSLPLHTLALPMLCVCWFGGQGKRSSVPASPRCGDPAGRILPCLTAPRLPVPKSDYLGKASTYPHVQVLCGRPTFTSSGVAILGELPHYRTTRNMDSSDITLSSPLLCFPPLPSQAICLGGPAAWIQRCIFQ